MNRVWISFEGDFPSWSDYLLDTPSKNDLDNYIKNLIVAIEWCSNRKVKALKIESVENEFDPVYQVIK